MKCTCLLIHTHIYLLLYMCFGLQNTHAKVTSRAGVALSCWPYCGKSSTCTWCWYPILIGDLNFKSHLVHLLQISQDWESWMCEILFFDVSSECEHEKRDECMCHTRNAWDLTGLAIYWMHHMHITIQYKALLNQVFHFLPPPLVRDRYLFAMHFAVVHYIDILYITHANTCTYACIIRNIVILSQYVVSAINDDAELGSW